MTLNDEGNIAKITLDLIRISCFVSYLSKNIPMLHQIPVLSLYNASDKASESFIGGKNDTIVVVAIIITSLQGNRD